MAVGTLQMCCLWAHMPTASNGFSIKGISWTYNQMLKHSSLKRQLVSDLKSRRDWNIRGAKQGWKHDTLVEVKEKTESNIIRFFFVYLSVRETDRWSESKSGRLLIRLPGEVTAQLCTFTTALRYCFLRPQCVDTQVSLCIK